jgi:Ca-activated chloride channel family protein
LLACDLALVLAVDVSGSVDRAEYQTQMQGLAIALQDGIVADVLVDQSAKVTTYSVERKFASAPNSALGPD